MKKQQEVVVTTICYEKGRVLLFRGSTFCHNDGGVFFDLPRVKVSFGEDPNQAVLRMGEELFSQPVVVGDVIMIDSYLSESRSRHTVDIVCRLIRTDQTRQLPERLGNYFWSRVEDYDKYVLSARSRDLLSRLLSDMDIN